MSEYVRVHDCLKSTGLAFAGVCFTCGKRFHIVYLQAGHCFSGRRNAVLFDVLCLRAQCSYCNETLDGRPKKFKKLLADLYSEEWLDNRNRRRHRFIKDNQIDFDKLQRGIERMRNNLLRKYGYKTFGEVLREGR